MEEEDEEWNRYGLSCGEDGFATGIHFEGLSPMGIGSVALAPHAMAAAIPDGGGFLLLGGESGNVLEHLDGILAEIDKIKGDSTYIS